MYPAVDISRYQGAWHDYPADIVIIKMSGGDDGLYMDSAASSNYAGAQAAGKHIGGYHFIGWTMGAAQEAAWFWRAMSPVAENDVFALDVENGQVAVPANAPEYVMEMISYLETQGVTGGLLYMNLSTLNAHDWSGPLSKWGLWLADWNNDPNATIPTRYPYVMQQYSDGPGYDHDEYFGPSLASFDAYGWHAAPATATTTSTEAPESTTTTTTEAPVSTPDPDPITTTSTTEGAQPEPPATTTTTTSGQDYSPQPTLWQALVAAFIAIINKLRGV